jgi:hypothetical protein
MQNQFKYLLIPSLVASAFGCAPPAKPKAPVAEVKDVTYSIPVVTPVESGTETQERKGVVMSVVPDQFHVEPIVHKECTEVVSEGSPALGGLVNVTNSSGDADGKIYEIKTETSYAVTPKVITFTVTATNHTDHVLRLAGSLPRLNINSRQVPLSQDGIAQMNDATLAPNDTVTFSLVGPEWDQTQKTATIDFQIFDVVVESDAAGNAKTKEHFKWTYQAKVEEKVVKSEKKTEQSRLKPPDAAAHGCPVLAAPGTPAK